MDQELRYGEDYQYIPGISLASGSGGEAATDVYWHMIQIVNICMIGHANQDQFVLIDAGMPGSAETIISLAEERFGAHCRPKAIVLTHGHFDHVGAIIELVRHWDVPVYAHPFELPFLKGEKSYPAPDPTVEGGFIAKLSSLFPKQPIQLGNHVFPLPADGKIPELPDFQWIHTPGHSSGHISLFRAQDRLLIAGDAFITVRQDSLLDVFTQKQTISGPPRYFTPDWEAAWHSVRKLQKYNPAIAITGHGKPVSGQELTEGLYKLATQFDQIAIPDYGKYV